MAGIRDNSALMDPLLSRDIGNDNNTLSVVLKEDSIVITSTTRRPSTFDEAKASIRRTSLMVIESTYGCWKSYGGLVMAFVASIFFSTSMLVIKYMENFGLRPFGAALLFNLGILVPSVISIIINEYGLGWRQRSRVFQGLLPIQDTQQWKSCMFLGIQAVLQALAVIGRTSALQFLTIGDMTVIVFSSPVVTTVIAHFVLKEKCGLLFIGIAIFTLGGVILITKPPILTGQKGFDTATLIGSGIAAGALICLSLTFVVTRKIKDQHVLAMTSFLGLIGVLISLPLFLVFEDWNSIVPEYNESIILTMSFLMTFLAMSSIMLALKMENAGLVALVRSCDVIFAFVLQYIFLGVQPDMLSGIGAAIVWIGVLLAGSHKYWTDRKARRKQLNVIDE